MTRTARKLAVNAQNFALKKKLVENGMPNIAAKVGVDFFAKHDSHLIEMGDQNKIIQQQVVVKSGKFLTFSISSNTQIVV